MKAHHAIWHPNTQMSEWERFSEIVQGDGMWLIDSTGHRMMDAVASMWCNVWGHSETQLIEALREQAARLQHAPLFNLTHQPAQRLAQHMLDMCPDMDGVFYSDNGSTAMEAAFKMAVQYWSNQGETGRNRLAGLRNGYHGDTLGAMLVSGNSFFGRFQSMAAPYPRFDIPGYDAPSEDWARCTGEIGEIIESDDTLAAVVMESGAQVAGGALIYPHGFQRDISSMCRKAGILMIADEVATGLGRLGSMTEYTSQESAPDIVAYSKMLTGGYLPMAATLATKKVRDAFRGEYDKEMHLFHGHTFTGNPLAAAVACRNLELYRERNLIQHVNDMSKILSESLTCMDNHQRVRDIRCKGMLASIHLEWEPPQGSSANRTIYEAGRKNGVYLRTLGNTILVVPPLAISGDEIAEMVSRINATIRDILR